MIKVDVDSVKKAVKVTASGTLKSDEVESYLKQLTEIIKKIEPEKYALIIDAKEQKAFAPDAVPFLEKALKLYTETPFAKRFSVVLESVIAMQQAKRVGKDEVDQFIMVPSIEDAYKRF